jgi:hypothetical protein
MVLSSAAAALVWPPLIQLSRAGRRREAVWLGIALGSLLLAGNGYMQVACAFAAPAILLLLPRERRKILSRYLLPVGIALLLAAPVLVPFLHFLPEFSKDIQPGFKFAQPLTYVPLNLVITDSAYYESNVLGKLPDFHNYALFIGWVPVLLAFWGLSDSRDREERRAVLFLAVVVFLSFWLASAGPQKLIVQALPFRPVILFLEGLRFTGLMAGLAVPAILALAGLGLNKLLAVRSWPALQLTGNGGTALSMSLRWLLAIPLLLAMLSAKKFGSRWIQVAPEAPQLSSVVAALHTKDLQWVSVPFGEHFWVQSAVARELKLTNSAYLTWHWDDRRRPDPILVASYGDIAGMTERSRVGNLRILQAPPGQEYSAVTHADGRRTVCSARGLGRQHRCSLRCHTAWSSCRQGKQLDRLESQRRA